MSDSLEKTMRAVKQDADRVAKEWTRLARESRSNILKKHEKLWEATRLYIEEHGYCDDWEDGQREDGLCNDEKCAYCNLVRTLEETKP